MTYQACAGQRLPTNPGENAAPPVMLADEIMESLAHCLKATLESRHRVTRIADRLLGPRPPESDMEAHDDPAQDGALCGIRAAIAAMQREADALHHAITRLEII